MLLLAAGFTAFGAPQSTPHEPARDEVSVLAQVPPWQEASTKFSCEKKFGDCTLGVTIITITQFGQCKRVRIEVTVVCGDCQEGKVFNQNCGNNTIIISGPHCGKQVTVSPTGTASSWGEVSDCSELNMEITN